MCAPEMCGQSLYKLSRSFHPIDRLELSGTLHLRESLKPVIQLTTRKRGETRQFFLVCLALCGKLEIVINKFSQQQWHKAERQLPQCSQIIGDEFPRLRGIARELLRFEVARKHVCYNN